MRICWSVPVIGQRLGSTRGDMVRAQAMIAALRAAGHEVVVVENASRDGADLAVGAYRDIVRRAMPRRLALVLRDLGRTHHFAAHAEEVVRRVRAARSELLVETQVGFADSGARAAALAGLPLVLDDCAPAREEIEAGCGLPRLARRSLARSLAAARLAAAPSSAIARELVAGGADPARVRVVSNGVDLGVHARADRLAFRSRAGFGRRAVIAFAGSFQPWHRVDLLLEAVAAQRANDDAALVVLIGDGPTRAADIELARRLRLESRLVLAGAVSPAELPSWLAASDIGVLAGTNDYGHPMKLVEYAAAGLARLAPDVPPVREALADGVDGLLFTPGDLAGLGSRLGELVRDAPLRARLGAAARERARGEDWSVKARALLEIP